MMRLNRVFLLIPLLILIFILNASRPGSRVEGCLNGCSILREDQKSFLRVVSLNMLHGRPKFEYLPQRIEIIANEITRLDADIILLQEVPWTLKMGNGAKVLAEKTGMNYAYLRANGNRWAIAFEEGEAILSRYPLKNPSNLELKPKNGFFEHRVVLHAIAETWLGEVDLFVTHLTQGEAEINRRQSVALMDFVELRDPGFAIIAGDFNAKPESPQIQELQSTWIDAYVIANPGDEGYTCCIDNLVQQDARLTKRIDYIFLVGVDNAPRIEIVQRAFTQPVEVDIGWLWASDHVGLMVDLEEGPEDAEEPEDTEEPEDAEGTQEVR
jgi:endonuclease/exonuclease/phosphatase family metal-dependent hydrolase